jgi:hypothetical protein
MIALFGSFLSYHIAVVMWRDLTDDDVIRMVESVLRDAHVLVYVEIRAILFYFFKELTKIQYNRTRGREGSLMPIDIESTVETKASAPGAVPANEQSGYFAPPFYPKQVAVMNIFT